MEVCGLVERLKGKGRKGVFKLVEIIVWLSKSVRGLK